MDTAKYEVPSDELRRVCDPSVYPYDTTQGACPLGEVLGQERAMRAIEFGLDMSSDGFNLFLAGQPGTGKTIILRRILEGAAKHRDVPSDVCYVHNFNDPDVPRAIHLPAGMGQQFQADVHELIADLQDLVPKAFEGKAYEDQTRGFAETAQDRKQRILDRLRDEALALGFDVKSTPMGIQTVAMMDGEPVTQEAYEQMDESRKEALDRSLEKVQEKVRSFLGEAKKLDRTLKGQLRELNRKVAMHVLGTLMLDLKQRYRDHARASEYLEHVQNDIVENVDQFRRQEEGQPLVAGMRPPVHEEPDLTRYRINLVVDNSGLDGAPVVFETNPTFSNLFGRIERRAQFGALITDFTMLRAGSLMRANGGYLVIDIDDLLRQPFVYDGLKRSLRNRAACLEDPAERFGLFNSQTLRPEPVPLDLKVCLIGRPAYYHFLFSFDEDFREIFKVKADFDYQANRSQDAVLKLGSFVARLVQEEALLPFDRTALAALVDESSRWVEDQDKLSMQFGRVNDLVRQAAYWARKGEAEVVTRDHLNRAVEEIDYRSNLVQEHVHELIQRDVIMVETDGDAVGQINGLAVHMLGDYLFGRPTKITANVYLGSQGVVNIERRVLLSHSTHDKGVLILSGFLGNRFAQDQPLSLTASLTFEQSYAEVAGDSASSTELYVLLSALANLPIRQGVAVTGSVNQKGQVQAIGGVNHKIEGFFDVCKARGLSGEQGVIVPKANLPHLMLRARVVDAVRDGKFRIWAIDHVDRGIEILTGVPAGERQADGSWPADTVNARVAERLRELGTKLKGWGREGVTAPELIAPRDSGGSEPPPPPRPPGRPPA